MFILAELKLTLMQTVCAVLGEIKLSENINFLFHKLKDLPNNKYFVDITETSPYAFGNFRKLSLYNCFMPI